MIAMRLFSMGLFLILQAAGTDSTGADGIPDANVIEPAVSIRQMLQDAQIGTLPADANQAAEELPVLDALIEELESLNHQATQSDVTEVPVAEPVEESPETALTPTEERIVSEETPAAALVSALPVEPNIVDLAAAAEVKEDILAGLLESLVSVDNPIEVGDALYLSGRMKQAKRFYQMAAEKKEAPDSPNYQWALYQIAACSVSDDPAEAQKLFQQLIGTYPNSPWAGAARARLERLNWAATLRKPVLESMQNDPNTL